jgi:hypothetical protein
MTTLTRGITLVATLGSLGQAVRDQNTLANPLAPALCVRVDDHAAVPDDILTSAKTVVMRIFVKVGVSLVWAGLSVGTPDAHGDPDACHGLEAARSLRVVILPDSQAEHFVAGSKNLGLAASEEHQSGHVAYVFYDRVRNLAVRYEQRRGAGGVLGHVMAHEVGHLLLPYGVHSETGLMRADWSRVEFEHAAHGLLLFTPAEAALIRRKLAK